MAKSHTTQCPTVFLELDVYVILCNIYLSYFILVSSAYNRLRNSKELDNKDHRSFLYEMQSMASIFDGVKASILNSHNKDRYAAPDPVADYKMDNFRVVDFSWLSGLNFPDSAIVSTIETEAKWFREDLDNNLDNRVVLLDDDDLPQTPTQIFVGTLVTINECMKQCITESRVGFPVGKKIRQWLKWSEQLSRRQPFASEQFSVEELDQGHYERLPSGQNDQFVHFSPGALFVAISVLVIDRINEYTNLIGDNLDDWLSEMTVLENAIGTFISEVVIQSGFFLSETDPSTMLSFPYIHELPLEMALSRALLPGRREQNVNPAFLFRTAFNRFTTASGLYMNNPGQRNSSEREWEHHDCITQLNNRIPYETLQKRLENYRKYVGHANKQKRERNGELKETIPKYNFFDDMVYLLGPNISKLLPNPDRPRSFGGLQSERFRSAN